MTQAVTLPTLFGGFALLRCVLLRERIDLVHAHQAFSTLGHEALMHARTMGYPTAFTDHSLFGFADVSSILTNKVLKYGLADVHHVICVSHTSKENTVLRACMPPARVSVIPNGQRPPPLGLCVCPGGRCTGGQRLPRRAAAISTWLRLPATLHGAALHFPRQRSKLRTRREPPPPLRPAAVDAALFAPDLACRPSDRINAVCLSRLVYRKGIDLLAAVLPELCREHPRLHFLIGEPCPGRAQRPACSA